MAGEIPITVIGHLTDTPELRFLPSGAAVANFTVASTPRVFDQQTGQWRDGDPVFLRCSLWRQAAEHLAESNLGKGVRVIVSGRLTQRGYDIPTGEKRTITEVQVEEIGASMRHATVTITKAIRTAGNDTEPTTAQNPTAANAGSGEHPSDISVQPPAE
jgi:single-strand DNA-binding protein